MRVSNNLIYSQMTKSIGQSTERLYDLNAQIASGKRINKPSDDPLGLAQVLAKRSELSSFEQYQSNITYADGWSTRTDTVISEVYDLLDRATELATQMASDTENAETRASAAEEIAEIREQVVSLANSKYGNKYLFGGTQTQTEPFLNVDVTSWEDDVSGIMTVSATAPASPEDGDQYVDTTTNTINTYDETSAAWSATGTVADGDRYIGTDGDIHEYSASTGWTVTDAEEGMSAVVTGADDEVYVYSNGEWTSMYQGNDSTFSVQIGKNDTVEVNISGSDLFLNDSGNVIMTLMNLEQSLRSNDAQGVSDSLAAIEDSGNVLSAKLSKVGAVMSRLDYTSSVLESAAVDNEESTSNIEDLDYAEGILELKSQQTIYEAVLQSATTITSMSLVDYMS